MTTDEITALLNTKHRVCMTGKGNHVHSSPANTIWTPCGVRAELEIRPRRYNTVSADRLCAKCFPEKETNR